MRKRVLILIVLIVLALLLIALEDIFKKTPPWEIPKNVGVAILIATVIAFIEPTLTKMINSHISIQARFGLKEIKNKRQDLDNEVSYQLKTAQKVKISSNCLAVFLSTYKESLEENLRNRQKESSINKDPIRIIVVSPKSRAIYERAILDRLKLVNRDEDVTLKRWIAGISELDVLVNSYPNHLKVLHSPFHITGSSYIIDDHLYLAPYIAGRRGSLCFCYHYIHKEKETPYNVYEKSFDKLWTFLEKISKRD